LIAVEEKSKDNAETRRALRFAEKSSEESSEKKAGPANSFEAQKSRLKDQRYI
jgi:hypothetical protein